MGLAKCMYVVWTPHALRHFPVDYNPEYFQHHIIPGCLKFLDLLNGGGKCPNVTQQEKTKARMNLYSHFPECDPSSIDRRVNMTEDEQVNLMQVNYLP
jgi:hypothetical protein